MSEMDAKRMTKKQHDRLDELLRMWIGELGVDIVRKQLPEVLAKHVEYRISSVVENLGFEVSKDNWARLEAAGINIERSANEALEEFLRDGPSIERAIREVISCGAASALVGYVHDLQGKLVAAEPTAEDDG